MIHALEQNKKNLHRSCNNLLEAFDIAVISNLIPLFDFAGIQRFGLEEGHTVSRSLEPDHWISSGSGAGLGLG